MGRARRAPLAADVLHAGLRRCIKVRVARVGLERSHETHWMLCTSSSRLRQATGMGLDARRPGAILVIRGPGEGQTTIPGGLPAVRTAAAHGRRGRCGNHRHRRIVWNLMYTQVETVVGASVVGTIYSD